MPKLDDDLPVCVACGGTGISSRGTPCSPCIANEVFARLAREGAEDAKIVRRREPAIKPIVTPPREPIKSALPTSARKLPIRSGL